MIVQEGFGFPPSLLPRVGMMRTVHGLTSLTGAPSHHPYPGIAKAA